MISLVLCDDHQAHNQTLNAMLQSVMARCPLDAAVALMATDAEETLAFARENKGDVIYFLDICLDENAADDPRGIRLALALRELNPRAYIVYVSAYQQYALDCCQSHAFDFLVKPFGEDKLEACLTAIAQDMRAQERVLPLTVNAGSRTLILDQTEIVYFRKQRDYVAARREDGSETVWRESLPTLLDRLSPGLFFRNHKSYCVNLRHVAGVDWGESALQLDTGEKLPLARRAEGALRSVLAGKEAEA